MLPRALITGALLMGLAGPAAAGTLVFNANTSDPAQKAGMEAAIARFEQENPDVDVRFNLFDLEAYKTSIRNFLTSSPPDVVTWYAGNRMRGFVERNLLEDVSDIWAAEGLDAEMAPSRAALAVDGKLYGVPYSYYQWGLYYRQDLFEKAGATVPTSWEQLLEAGQKLNAAGVTPVTIGTKAPWTSAGWFDYLNLRTNGYDFHIALTEGKVAWTDAKVRQTFANWQQLIDAKFFLANHASYSWQEAQPFLYNGTAAMYLIGNFIVPNFPAELKGKIGFARFPTIDAAVPGAEDAPTDTLHIPAGAKNKVDARRFLAFMARPEVQSELNAKFLTLPPNKDATVADDPFLKAGAEVLGATKATAQFFDRDADEEMARLAMQGFQEFMVHPDRLDAILTRLEQARARINKA